MQREEIIAAIQRTTEDNGGRPLGKTRFERATGIGEAEWLRYWSRFGDAQREAGFEPNRLNAAYDDAYLFKKIIELIRELGKFPTEWEKRTKAYNDPTFPTHNTFTRLGNKAQFVSKLLAYCADKPEYADIVELLEPFAALKGAEGSPVEQEGHARHGFVYLLRERPGQYKIGHAKSPGRRHFELSAGTPTELDLIHKIETDDPEGVEKYWHKRFEGQRIRREWFKLSAGDVKAFKRWKRIY